MLINRDRGKLRSTGRRPLLDPRTTLTQGNVTMQRRMTKVTALVSVLLLGVFAAPAAAQQADEEIVLDPPVEVEGEQIEGVTALQCAVGVAQANADLNIDVFNEVFAIFFPDFDEETLDVGEVADGQEQALVDATVEFLAEQGQTLADVCSIYIVDVLPEVQPEATPDPDPVPPAVRPEQPEQAAPVATEVLGVSLQRTGIDALLMAVIGAGLLGLGVVAVRRTRDGDTPA